jgi:hypothetical protein
MKKLIINPENPNGILIEETTEEIAQREIDNASIETEKQEETNKKNARTSAINKLKGATYSALTDAEAKALFGE